MLLTALHPKRPSRNGFVHLVRVATTPTEGTIASTKLDLRHNSTMLRIVIHLQS